MEQIEINSVSAPECDEITIYVERFEKGKERPIKQLEYKESIKNRVKKLFKMTKRNAKYIKEVIPIQRLEQRRIFRDYGIR